MESCGASGGFDFSYNNDFNVNILFANKRIIDIQTIIEKKTIYMSFIYGDPVPKFREEVWE